MEHVDIYRNTGSYVHNPDVVRLPNGEMLLVLREAPRRRNCTHIDPESRATLLRSSDNGRTWNAAPPVTAASGPGYVGIQDPSIALLRDGRLICNFFAWDAPPDAPYGAEVPGTYITISEDGGHTWSNELIPVELSPNPGEWCGTTDALVELPNGDLLMPMYDNMSHKDGGGDRAYVNRSTDGGATWHPHGTMAYDPFGNLDFDEPALAVLPSGKVVAMIREEKQKTCLWCTESEDGGATWSHPRRTNIWGFPADLLPLKSGRLLCTYGYRRAPFGARACISSDEGQTWDVRDELILHQDGVGPDVGYPSSVQLDDGTIFTAYYLSELAEGARATASDDPAAHFAAGGARYITGTYYREW